MTATVGKGTDLCRTCEGAKEPTRRGSENCRACDSEGRASRRMRMFRLTLSIPQTTWDALAAEETTPYRAARRVLNEWAQAQITGASPSTVEPARSLHTHTGEVMRPPTLTNDQLARARKWIADTERTLPPDMTTRRQLRAWLESEGFRP